MKITHNKVGQNLNVRDSGLTSKASDIAKKSDVSASKLADSPLEAFAGNEAGRVNVSSRAQDMKRAKDIAMATPDVDEAKVARLQKMIDEGTYKVDAEKVAGKMIDEHSSWE